MIAIRKYLLLSLTLFLYSDIIGQTSNWLWARSGIGAKTDEGASVATDASGNVYAAGYFSSPSDIFGNDTLFNNGGNQNLFLVKYDSLGNVLWATSGSKSTVATDITIDNSGNVYVTGYFFDAKAIFGTDTLFNSGLTGVGNFFLLKYDPSGTLIWAKSGTSANDLRGKSISIDLAGNIYVTGWYMGPTATFGTHVLNNVSNNNIFLIKYTPAGNVIWIKAGGCGGPIEVYAVATDISNNSYVTGSYRLGNMIFGGYTLTNSSGAYAIFFAKYDSTGNLIWANREGGPGFGNGYGLGADKFGNIFMTGTCTGSTFGTHNVSDGLFLVKYNSSGSVIWAKGASSSNTATGYNLSTDNTGSIYVSGGFNTTLTFGSTTITPPPSVPNCNTHCDPMLIIKYDSSGAAVCGNSLISGGDDYNDITIDNFGNVYTGGDFLASPFVLGNDTLTLLNPSSSIISENVFVAKCHFNCNTNQITELNNWQNISISPNPTSNQFVIDVNSTDRITLDIYDVNGRHMLGKTVKNKSSIDVSGLNEGVYFVTTKTGGRIINKKLVIVR